MRTIDDGERRARLAVRHGLVPEARPASVEAAVEAMTCLHATEPASVYLSAFARSGASREEMDAALYERRSVVRQLAMRRTVFAFPAALVPAALGSASARVARQLAPALARELEAAGVADDGVAWLTALGDEVLARVATGPASTATLRDEIPGLAVRVNPSPGKSYGREMPIASRVLTVLAADGELQRGRNDGGWKLSRPVWTLREEWLEPGSVALDEREGYAELVRRWLWTFGPGTEADLAWWLGATKGAVRRALEDVGAVEARLEDSGAAWLHPDDDEVVAPPKPWAALLPALDPTTMGWKGRGFYLGEHAERIFDRNGNGGPTAWWDGRIVGGWIQDDDGTVEVVEAESLPPDARRALDDQAAELTGWMDGEVVRSTWQSPLGREAVSRAGHGARSRPRRRR